MGLLRSLVLLPVKGPMDGAVWVASKVNESVQQEWNNPASIRKALVTLEKQLLAEEITEDAYDVAETELLLRLKALT
ncbi:MAG: gas vesicle protein GvpG [Pseudomonadota bacterium]